MATRRRRFLDVVSEGACFLVICCLVWMVDGLTPDESCLATLGMETGKIRDSSISASSSYDSGSVGPHHARLRNNKQGGAWCPKHMVSRDSREYLEIDLGDIFVLTGAKTQGRFGNGQGQEYAEQYMVEYWRPGLAKWVRWRDRSGKELLSGNSDTFTIVDQIFDPPVISSKVRILPYSDHVRTVCMRLELTGCPWKDGLLSYNMPQGVAKGDLDLRDKMYDGSKENGQLNHGLGQLTDGQKGKDNFKGYEWIGWRNDTPGWAGLPLEILFEFDKVRNFSAAHLYTNNLFSKDVQVFSHARAFLSLNGYKFSPEPVHFSYMPDLVMEHSRNVTIKLHQRIGKFLKLQLYFASRWILLSEVSFDSTVVGGNFTQEPDAEMGIATLPDFVGREYPIQRDEVKAAVTKGATARNIITSEDLAPPHQKSTSNQTSEPKSYIGFVIGILTVIILVLTSAIFFIILRNQRLRNTLTTLPVVAEDLRDVKNEKGTINEDNKEQLYAESGSTYYSQNILTSCPNYTDIPDLVSKGYQMQELIDTSHSDMHLAKPPPLPPPPQNYYLGEDAGRPVSRGVSPPLGPGPMNRSTTARSHLILPLSPHKTSESDYGCPKFGENVRIKKISSEKLRIIEKVGSGHFGDLHLCEIAVGTPLEHCDTSVISGEFKLGVVCTLKNDSLLDDFRREASELSNLEDPNVATFLGASLDQTPYYFIREYAQFGDLCQVLQDHVAESTTAVATNASILSYGCLIYMATQIASGMKYLESVMFVHKDLAARNCLVGQYYEIKISDLGSQRAIYTQDYCQVAGSNLVPLRWMAWESALLGKYSSKSDVWSFAVLLWEILTFAREQPFELFSDDKVLENLAHFYQNNGKQVYLNIPYNCPKEIFDLMVECWNRNESDRPTFREIHLFLQRKNLGFNPKAH